MLAVHKFTCIKYYLLLLLIILWKKVVFVNILLVRIIIKGFTQLI